MNKPKVAVVGIGWWSQGWHLPHLYENPNVELVAIVDRNAFPQSKLNPDMEPLDVLAERYKCRIYSSLDDLLEKEMDLQGILLATPHATHYALGKQIIEMRPTCHLMMEKPMTTITQEAEDLLKLVQNNPQGSFLVNHSANYRPQARQARDAIHSGRIGTVRHVTAHFASPLKWIFEESSHVGWNKPTKGMIGNGFAWGQLTHLLGWIFHVCPTTLQPQHVSCHMAHSSTTGADVAVAATIQCYNNNNDDDNKGNDVVIMSISGTSLLPGYEHSDPPVGKRVHIEVYGDQGALFYHGVDRDRNSGKLTLVDNDAQETVLNHHFDFENLEYTGTGPESLQSWIQACQGDKDYYVGADCELGLKNVQTVAAMYESHHTKQLVAVQQR